VDTLDDLIKRSGLSYQQVTDAMQVSRSTLHIWRTKDEVPPARISDMAKVLGVDQLEVPTSVDRAPGTEAGYASLHALPEEFLTELGGFASTSDEITFLGLAGIYPIEQLPLFKERSALAVAEGTLRMRVLIGDPTSSYALARAAEEGHTEEAYAERVAFAVEKWGQVLGDAAAESIRFFDFWPAIMLYRFGDHGILAMPHLPHTGGYDMPVVWHNSKSPTFKPYADFLDRAWDMSHPAIS